MRGEDQELEAQWWRTLHYLATTGSRGSTLNGGKPQSRGKVVDLATLPTPKNVSDARSGLGLVNQVAYHAQLRDTATPP